MSETVALEKKKQSRFSRKIKSLKEDVKSGIVNVKEEIKKPQKERGVVYIGHIPHGFFEPQMQNYFKQFGKVTNVRMARSKKTGKSKGYAFVEFDSPEVAKIVAETMDNYLMFKKRVIAKYVPPEKQRKTMFKGKSWNLKSYPRKMVRDQMNRKRNRNLTDEEYMKDVQKYSSTLQKKLDKLEQLGINYIFKAVDVPINSIKPETDTIDSPQSPDSVASDQVESDEESQQFAYQVHSFDSDIEVKVPISNKNLLRKISGNTKKQVGAKRNIKKKNRKQVMHGIGKC